MTRKFLFAIIIIVFISCKNSSTKNEGNEDTLQAIEDMYFADPFDFENVDTVILMSDKFEFINDSTIPISIINPDKKLKLIGELGLKLGETATVCGIIIDGPSKGYGDGPNLLVQKINGVSIQRFIQIPVKPYPFMEFGKHPLPKLEYEETYRFRLYETGEFVGTPDEAFNEAGIVFQETGFYFQNRLILISGKKTNKVEWKPADFLGREALLQGIAKNEGSIPIIYNSKWKLKLLDVDPWNESEIGKQVEVFGKVQKENGLGSYYVKGSQPGLIQLEDQLGKKVKLRGTVRSENNYWWFHYRGTDLYIDNIDKLPDWEDVYHWQSIEVKGFLEHERLPDIEQIGLKEDRDLKMYYIIRDASWSPVDELLSLEKELNN